ncbi:MAG: trigger factor [bacterium]|nr:trigger factor [bacterium]
MNIQTERLEDHKARFTVEIEPERLDNAKKAAARALAKRVSIPGFRKGKAPYHLVVQYLGENNILQDALDELSQEIYRETIGQADIEPYGPGSWDDFKLEPSPTFIYTVPLQPTVTLGDYRSVRMPFEVPPVEDDQVDEAMRRLQEQEALVEESARPVEIGNRVTIDIHSHFTDDPKPVEGDAAESSESEAPPKGMEFVHQHDGQINLGADDEPIMTGFKAAILGANAGQELEFELTVPEDEEDFSDIAGRKIEFHVTVKKIENVTLPALNDDFAARVTQSEEKPLTLLELRMRMRENLQNAVERQARERYANEALQEMVKQSTVSYPDAMVQEQIDAMVKDIERRLQQQSLSLDAYYRLTGRTAEQLREDYRESAVSTIKRTLVLREIVNAERVDVSEDEINKRIDELAASFGEQAEAFRGIFDTPNMRNSILNELLEQNVMNRVIAIARGEAPVLDAAPVEALAQPNTEADATAAEVSGESGAVE